MSSVLLLLIILLLLLLAGCLVGLFVECKRGQRVAFSCYGSVTALNGQPESSVTMEAVGVGASCAEYQEDATSESNGQFRIRGLLPQVSARRFRYP